MEHVTRTLVFSALQSAMVRGAAYKWTQYTTLNEKFNVLPREYPAAAVSTPLSYLAIGRGGLDMEVGADGNKYPAILQHKSTDCALFNHMPFALRLPEDDLEPEYRNRYAMRVQVTINGVIYWAYYLKRVDFSQADTDLLIKRVLPDNGGTQVTDWVPDESNLNPVPEDLSESGANLLAGYSAIASTIVTLPLDTYDINQIRNASKIITGETGRAIISEAAICTGTTKLIQAPSQLGSFPFNEALGVMCAAYMQTLYPLDQINESLTDQLELGISEPLFRVEGVNQ